MDESDAAHYNLTERTQVQIGRRIREERERQNINQARLAMFINVSKQQLSKYETGKNEIQAIRLWKLAKYLQVDIRMFFGEKNRERDSIIDIDDDLLMAPDIPELLRKWKNLTEKQRSVILDLLQIIANANWRGLEQR
jgi:transcriptional regulator with XRE-family HTH domain